MTGGPARPVPAWRILIRGELLLLHLVAVAAVAAMTLAGWWQLEVWRDQQALDQRQQVAQTPVPLNSVLGPDDAVGAESDAVTVRITGRYAPADEQFLLPGRAGGTWVVSPLLVEDTDAAVLVVRGAVDGDTPAPLLPLTPSGRVDVTGVVQASEPFDTDVGPGRQIEALNVAVLVSEVPYDLYSGYVVRTAQDPPDPDESTAVSPTLPDPSWQAGVRNLVYAVQWWVFAAFTAFMWWRVARDRVQDHRAIAEEAAATRVATEGEHRAPVA